MEKQYLIDCAVAEGFAAAEVVSTDQIVFDPSFRPYCAENICGQYDANYTCPPYCGTPTQMRQRIQSHKKALVLQTIHEVADYSDTARIKQAKKAHNQMSLHLMKKLRQDGCPGFLVGASGCSLCSPCRMKLGEPCAFPDQRYSCMSAYCIFVSRLAQQCGMEYDCGEGLLAFFGMYVYD